MRETLSFAGAAVCAPHPAAAVAARDVLIEGGNAIEAAVAALAVVSVVLPQTAGAGGDGLWLIREAGRRGRTRVLDARGPVCDGATLRHFRERQLEAIPHIGGDAILTVPGAVAGWRAALDLSRALEGRLPVGRLLEPAIALARTGFEAPDPAVRPLPSAVAEKPGIATTFLGDDGKAPAAGTWRRAVAWGETLGYLAQSGLDDVYRGDVGREIVQDLEAIGSLLGRADLRHFEPRWRDPWSLRSAIGLMEAPPTRAALGFLVALGLFSRLPPSSLGSAAHLHGRIEVVKQAAAMLAEAEASDPSDLLAPSRLLLESERIDARRAAHRGFPADTMEDSGWIGVIDSAGLAVSVVQSVGTPFGSSCLLPRTALLMGNRGARFELDGDNGLALRRGRRAPMDALPIILTGERGALTCLGVGRWPLATAIGAQFLAGAGLADAIEAPRAGPGPSADIERSIVLMEEEIDPSVIAALSRAGHEIHPIGSLSAGEAGGLRRNAEGRVEAAADPRRGGGIAGL